MQKVLTAAEMREVDRLTTEKYGIPSVILMENAAHAVVRVITERLGGSVKGKSILVVCGKGNNGGDGAAIARVLWQQGASVFALLVGDLEETTGDAQLNFKIMEQIDGERLASGGDFNKSRLEPQKDYAAQRLKRFLDGGETELYVDAMFGTGLTKPLGGVFAEIADLFSNYRPPTIAVDIPSGLDADKGEVIGPAVTADATVTFTAPKLANVLPPASNRNGEVVVATIGSPDHLVAEQPSKTYLAEIQDVHLWLRETKFSTPSYKNKRGHALIIAGSESYSGAAVLCGNAAMRSGVGLVTVGAPRSSKDSIASRVVPEVIVRPLAETEGGAVSDDAVAEVEGFLKNVDAVAIGCGLSVKDESTKRFVRHFVDNRRVPTILDADALTLLSPWSEGSGKPPEGGTQNGGMPSLILTPHQGEFLRMLGTEDKDAIKDRVAAVREFARKHNVILVLKGERNLISEPGGNVVVNPTGNSGLGKAGNGDTLTGIIAGFAAQSAAMKVDMFETVVAAVYVAGMAGDIAEKKFGKRVMTASDVRDCLGEAFRELEGVRAG